LSGRESEEIAVCYLRKKKYQIVERNLRFGGGEIDILAVWKNFLCIVEVKKRERLSQGEPLEFISNKQQTLLKRAAKIIMSKREFQNYLLRFEAIAIFPESDQLLRLNHYINILEDI